MYRRGFLGTVAGGIGTFAGCVGGLQDGGQEPPGSTQQTPPSTPETPATTREVVGTVGGVDLPIPRSEIRTALPRDAIPAIVDPAFAPDWGGLDPEDVEDPSLPTAAAVIGVERDGRARAYPLRVLDWHEVVNDGLGGPIAVTYCVLCGSSVVLERRVDGAATRFGVSGKLWRNDLVLYDEATDSLWSQLLAAAIRGPRAGDRLRILPSTLTTWGEWRATHPETDVLLPPPHSDTVRGPDATYDYFEDKYPYDGQSQLIGFDDEADGERHPRTMVVGVRNGGETRAYPFDVVLEAGVVEDSVGGRPVVVALAPDDTLVAYDRRVDGRARSFEAAGERHLRAANTRWERTTGRAVEGRYVGERLERANEHPPMFWEGWSNFNPDTTVYGEEG